MDNLPRIRSKGGNVTHSSMGTVYPPSIQNDAEIALERAEGTPSMQLPSAVNQDVPGTQNNGLILVFND